MKDAGLRIRVQKELRDKFIEACRRRDVPAAQVLREFMRGFVDEQAGSQTPARQNKHRRKSDE